MESLKTQQALAINYKQIQDLLKWCSPASLKLNMPLLPGFHKQTESFNEKNTDSYLIIFKPEPTKISNLYSFFVLEQLNSQYMSKR